MTIAEQLKNELDKLDAQIAHSDKLIEEAEERQSKRRQYGDRLFNLRLKKAAQLEREEAVLKKKIGPCVEEIAHDGTVWRV